MAVRLIVTITAAPGKGSELAQAYRGRCAEISQEPGCEQFEALQSVVNPTSWFSSNAGPTRRRWTCMQIEPNPSIAFTRAARRENGARGLRV